MKTKLQRISSALLIAVPVQCSVLALGDGDAGKNILAAGAWLGMPVGATIGTTFAAPLLHDHTTRLGTDSVAPGYERCYVWESNGHRRHISSFRTQKGGSMKIKVPRAAAESGTLRIWLHRVPVSSDTVYAFRLGPDGKPTEEVARADVYGRGEGSVASERYMLLFRFLPRDGLVPPHAGEELELRIASPDGEGYVAAKLDILEIF